MNHELKKLIVLESTNQHLNYKGLDVYNSELTNEIIELRAYVSKLHAFDAHNDPQVIFDVLHWVSDQWSHDGFNDPGLSTPSVEILKRAHRGERFRCVEYGRVASDILLSMGYTSRRIGLRTEEADYGGAGMGHVASEVWSNRLKKWIFIDPQFGAYFIKNGNPLNYYEIYLEWKNNQLVGTNIAFDETKEIPVEQSHREEYKDFITRYFGYVQTNFKGAHYEYAVSLMLDGKREAMTFQASPLNNVTYTKEKENLYFDLNQCVLSFRYHDEVDFMKLVSENQIDSEASFLANQHKFTVKPNLKVTCHHNTPNFSHYEYTHDGETWIVVDGNEFDWYVCDGISQVSVRSVNSQGLKGVPCTVKMQYE